MLSRARGKKQHYIYSAVLYKKRVRGLDYALGIYKCKKLLFLGRSLGDGGLGG